MRKSTENRVCFDKEPAESLEIQKTGFFATNPDASRAQRPKLHKLTWV